MELLQSYADEMQGLVTYRLSNGRYVRFCRNAVREHGIANLLQSVGETMPTERVDVMWRGRKVGTLPGDFDPHNIKSSTFLYDPRPGDFRREGDVWVANKMLGRGDLDAVPGFQR